MTPKPLAAQPKYKLKRLRERKPRPMTLVAAFRCQRGGVLLCADRQEDDGEGKREVDKIYRIPELHAFDMFIAGAGPTSAITKANAEIHQALVRAEYDGLDLWKDHSKIIESTLKSIYREYSSFLKTWPIEFLFVIAERTRYSPLLYKTESAMLVPEPFYAAIGSGKRIADYLSGLLFEHDRLDKAGLAALGAFILRETERSCSGVGSGADMVFIHEDGRGLLHLIHKDKVREIQDGIPSAADAIHAYWKDRAKVPAWIDVNTRL